MLRTWLMPRHGEGKVTVLFRAPRPVNTISFDFKQFSCKLFVSAQSCTCLSSLALVSELTAGTITYVSSANLTSALPTCIGWRSDAVTTKDAGKRWKMQSFLWRWPKCPPVRKCRPQIWCSANGHWRNPWSNCIRHRVGLDGSSFPRGLRADRIKSFTEV